MILERQRCIEIISKIFKEFDIELWKHKYRFLVTNRWTDGRTNGPIVETKNEQTDTTTHKNKNTHRQTDKPKNIERGNDERERETD